MMNRLFVGLTAFVVSGTNAYAFGDFLDKNKKNSPKLSEDNVSTGALAEEYSMGFLEMSRRCIFFIKKFNIIIY